MKFELPSPPRAVSRVVKAVAGGAALVAIVVVAFLALGGSGGSGIDPVAQAATVSTAAPGYQMHLSMLMTSPAFPTPITATGDGTFDGRTHSASVSIAMNFGNVPQLTRALGSSILDIREILAGTTIYMKLPPAAVQALPLGGKQWLAINLAKAKGIPGVSSLLSNPTSSNPAQFLQYLRAESDSIATVGTEQVGGVMTTHYHVDLNFDRVAGALPAADRAAVSRAIATIEQETHLHRVPADVWVDGHHLVRRIKMAIAVPASTGPGLTENMTIDFVHYGVEPAAAPPPAGQVTDMSGLLG